MPGRTLIVHPAFVAVHGVIVVPGSVYPAAQERISWVPLVLSVLKPIQLIPLSELTFKRWLKPTGLLMLVRLGLPIPCASVDSWLMDSKSDNCSQSTPSKSQHCQNRYRQTRRSLLVSRCCGSSRYWSLRFHRWCRFL